MLCFAAFEDHCGNTQKFERVYQKYHKPVYYCALNILKDHGFAEDALQETFLRVSKNLHKIDEVDCNKTFNFLVTIVRNVSFTMLRKQRGDQVLSADELELDIEDSAVSVEDLVVSTDNVRRLMQQIATLKEELRQPLLLRYVNHMSEKEIANALGISTANVAVRIHRAKKKLSTILTSEGVLSNATKQ